MLMNTLRNYNWTQRFRARAGRAEPEARRQRFPQAVYWRRRLVALVAALAILSLIAWAFFGVLGLSSGPSGAARSRQGAGERRCQQPEEPLLVVGRLGFSLEFFQFNLPRRRR